MVHFVSQVFGSCCAFFVRYQMVRLFYDVEQHHMKWISNNALTESEQLRYFYLQHEWKICKIIQQNLFVPRTMSWNRIIPFSFICYFYILSRYLVKKHRIDESHHLSGPSIFLSHICIYQLVNTITGSYYFVICQHKYKALNIHFTLLVRTKYRK